MRRVSHPTVRQPLAGSAVLPCVFTLQTNSSAQTPHLLWTRSASQPGEAGVSPQQVVLSAKGESEYLLIGSAVKGTCSLRRVFFHHCMALSLQRLGALFTVLTKHCAILQLVILFWLSGTEAAAMCSHWVIYTCATVFWIYKNQAIILNITQCVLIAFYKLLTVFC